MRSLFGVGRKDDNNSPLQSSNVSEKAPSSPKDDNEVGEGIMPVFDVSADQNDGPLQEIKSLSEDEQNAFEKVKADIPKLIKDLPPVDPELEKYVDMDIPLDIEGWLTDECIARYVRARKGVYEDIKRALRKTIEWRATTRPHALKPETVEVENRTGKMYLNGFDKFSRPVIYMYNNRQNTKEADNQIRWVIYTLEMCIRHMRPGVEKVTLAINATYWGFSNAVSLGTAKKFLDVLGNHYPERLGRAVIFQPPRFFVAFYNLVSPFIDPVTKAKVAFVNPDTPPAVAASEQTDKQSSDTAAPNNNNSPWIAIEDCFKRDELEVDCYGEWKFQYNHSVYWKELEAEFTEFKAKMVGN